MNAAARIAAAALLCGVGISAFAQENNAVNIVVKSDAHEIVCTLNGSTPARALLAQLPLTQEIGDRAGKEKTFFPPQKLDTAGAPLSEGKKGNLAYFAPWNNVVLFYGHGGPYPGLHALGECSGGAENIDKLRGRVTVSVQE